MAIVKMSKFSLLVFGSERKDLLHDLQKFDFVHFLDLKEASQLSEFDLDNIEEPESIVSIDKEINRVSYGIEQLSKYRQKESALKTLKEGKVTLEFLELEDKASQIDYKSLCNRIIKINGKKEQISQDIDNLNQKVKELKPWIKLDVPFKDLKSLDSVKLILGAFPKRFEEKVKNDLIATEYTYYELLSESNGNLYFLMITNDQEEDLVMEVLRQNNYIDVEIETEGRPKEELAKLEEELDLKHEQISNYEGELTKLSQKVFDLQIVYEYLMNVKLRITESENFLTTDNINVIEGYVPTNMSDKFTNIINSTLSNKVYDFQIEEADVEDPEVPILLENSKYPRAFESLTTMYAYPKYNELDPTPAMAPFYSFFFGMMVADAGYGLVLFLATAIVLKVFNLSKEQENTMRFFYCQSFFIILWGIIYGSFFSFSIPTRLLDPSTQYMEVLIVSIAFGVIHIFVGLGISAYVSIRNGKVLDALFDVGFWYMTLTGAILLLLAGSIGLSDMVSKISLYAMIIGMIGIVLTGGRESPSIVGKLGGGLYSLYGISSYVGDFISYSRLMALGLSGGYLAAAINDMAYMLFDINVIGVLFGIIVLIIGHMFNLFLSLLSAYVHDIRLTYVEYFGKFYDGGGKAFKLLRSKSKYINIE